MTSILVKIPVWAKSLDFSKCKLKLIMVKLLKAKHWQLFLLMFILPGFLHIYSLVLATTTGKEEYNPIIFGISNSIFIGIFFSWLYAMAINLYRKLPVGTVLNIKVFRIAFFIALLFLILSFCFFFTHSLRIFPAPEPPLNNFFPLVFSLQVFYMICILYCFNFIARSLKAIELQRPVSSIDAAADFFLLWFFPIGIWIIQPRINKIFNN